MTVPFSELHNKCIMPSHGDVKGDTSFETSSTTTSIERNSDKKRDENCSCSSFNRMLLVTSHHDVSSWPFFAIQGKSVANAATAVNCEERELFFSYSNPYPFRCVMVGCWIRRKYAWSLYRGEMTS
jgi:hypothetical protein